METFLQEPKRIPLILRFAIALTERFMKKRMTPARLLAWYPKAAVGAGIMEGLVAHDEKEVPKRTLQLVRMQVSIQASCPFCIDMNSAEYGKSRISGEEIRYMQAMAEGSGGGNAEGAGVAPRSLTDRELAALAYARSLTATPISLSETLLLSLRELYDERGIVILASTAAQVNFWTRAIQGLGLPPLGFTENCPVDLDRYATVRKEER